MSNRIHLFSLTLIFILAVFLRLYRLDQIPPSPYWEEAALGYDAYSIVKTGKDHHGSPYPILSFPSFGDYKPSGYFYAIVPFVKVLGMNIWSVRLPSAIAGIISVGVLYLIGKELFDKQTGLIAGLLFAIQPWAINFSRGGWEVNLALMWLVIGAWCLVKARKQPYYLLLAACTFGLSMYTYHAARLFAPVISTAGVAMLLWQWKKTYKGKIIPVAIAFFLGCMLVSPFLLNLRNKTVSSRFTETSIFSNLQPILDSNMAIASHGNTIIARLVYHRYWYFGKVIIEQWFSHFSPIFLFVRGDGNYRHGGWTGLLYPIDAVFILISVSFLFSRNKKLWSVLFWIAVVALAPALVTPAPHALRFLFAAPAFALFAAVSLRHYKKITLFACIFYLILFTRFTHTYFTEYQAFAASDWQYGYKELYATLAKEKKNGEQIYVTREQGRPAMYYLFYSQYDPVKLQSLEPNLPKDQLELLQVGDYHFIDSLPGLDGLYATSESKVDPSGKILDMIYRPDNSIVWVIWRKEKDLYAKR